MLHNGWKFEMYPEHFIT